MSSPFPFPPSSAPAASPSGQSSAAQSRPFIDPLAFDDVRGLGGSNTNARQRTEAQTGESTEERQQRAPRRTIQDLRNIPQVRDATGEFMKESFSNFLEGFTEEIDIAPTPGSSMTDNLEDKGHYYIDQIRAMSQFGIATLHVDFKHLLEREPLMAQTIQQQYYRFLPFLRRALGDLVKKHNPTWYYINTSPDSNSRSVDNLTTREFYLSFYDLPLTRGIRDLRMDKVGQLVSISGTVTRTSEVRPELVLGTFKCGNCEVLAYDIEQQFKYTEPLICFNPPCQNRKHWSLVTELSKFSDWQKVRIQENANEIPTGSMPRSLDVILRAETVERAKAGDKCTFAGAFVVVPDVAQLTGDRDMVRQSSGRADNGISNQGVTGLKALGVRDLSYKTAFLTCSVRSADLRGRVSDVRADDGEETMDEYLESLTQAEMAELNAMVNTPDIYSRLVASIAPTVYGHEIVKKGILLQLMGGVHKQTQEGIHLRGDINVCIVGDPSTSKSQFLKYVCSFLPRAVYTSGKASSAAGLTAAVVKDEESGEFTIEAGALMLADNGICAIDEFDKMDVADQVAIHEAMEQQTISIAKAGIQATLNARTSILAAANPIGGRYNRKISLRQNIAMSAPIMSRFDLFFVVLDECNEETDRNLASHIVRVHRFQNAAIAPEFSTESLQRFIRYARTFKPKLTKEASEVLVAKYRKLREDQDKGGKSSFRITVRQLESMIRLSEAIARASCKPRITPEMVKEAHMLLRKSIVHVEQDDISFEDAAEDAMDEDIDAAQVAALDAAESSFNAAATAEPSSVAQQPQRQFRITYNRYMEIMNMIVMYLADRERDSEFGVERSELIQWYMEQREDVLESVEAAQHEEILVGRAINKLVSDSYLLQMRGEIRSGLLPEDAPEEPSADEKIYYMVHPQVDLSDLSSSVPV